MFTKTTPTVRFNTSVRRFQLITGATCFLAALFCVCQLGSRPLRRRLPTVSTHPDLLPLDWGTGVIENDGEETVMRDAKGNTYTVTTNYPEGTVVYFEIDNHKNTITDTKPVFHLTGFKPEDRVEVNYREEHGEKPAHATILKQSKSAPHRWKIQYDNGLLKGKTERILWHKLKKLPVLSLTKKARNRRNQRSKIKAAKKAGLLPNSASQPHLMLSAQIPRVQFVTTEENNKMWEKHWAETPNAETVECRYSGFEANVELILTKEENPDSDIWNGIHKSGNHNYPCRLLMYRNQRGEQPYIWELSFRMPNDLDLTLRYVGMDLPSKGTSTWRWMSTHDVMIRREPRIDDVIKNDRRYKNFNIIFKQPSKKMIPSVQPSKRKTPKTSRINEIFRQRMKRSGMSEKEIDKILSD